MCSEGHGWNLLFEKADACAATISTSPRWRIMQHSSWGEIYITHRYDKITVTAVRQNRLGRRLINGIYLLLQGYANAGDDS